jgi:hypothetical protein
MTTTVADATAIDAITVTTATAAVMSATTTSEPMG